MAPTAAVFYRHWLELRRPMLLTVPAVVLATIGFGFAVEGASGYFETSGKLAGQVAHYDAVFRLDVHDGLIPATLHASIAAFLGLFASAAYVGGGYGGSASMRNSSLRHPSVYFTASLPLSRSGLSLTRLSAGFGSLLAILTLSLLSHVLVLLVIQRPIPLAVMAGTTAMAAVGGLGLMALVGVVTVISSGTLSGIVMFAIVMSLWLTESGWRHTIGFLWPRALEFGGALTAASAMALLSVVFMRRKDL